MNCHHVQNLISAFIDDELGPLEKRELRRHLFFCSECYSEYQNFLRLKECLNNLNQEPLSFNTLAGFRLRVAEAEHSIFPDTNRLFILGRLGLIGGCITLFFLSTIALFPKTTSSNQNLTQNTALPELAPPSMSASATKEETKTMDLVQGGDLSWDEPVTVYQASSILP